MFEGHFGLRENPFAAAHQSRFIYPSPEHQEALAHLRYGIENREPFVLITGEVGTGKTTALFDALSEWEGRAIVGLITNSSLTRAELLEEIALRLGMSVPQNASKPQIMVALERHLLAIHQEGLRAILLLDEAQNLERELLEEIRLLSNLEVQGEKLVQIFLVGQPELEGRLQLPELRQLRQRIAVHYRLRPLGAADAERYIHYRITVAGGHALSIFPAEACTEVHHLTNGIPREMNHLCSQSMVVAFVEGAPAVQREHVRAAAEELEFQSVLGKERRTRNVPTTVERRQGPTIPGAAPPPERETKFATPPSSRGVGGPPPAPVAEPGPPSAPPPAHAPRSEGPESVPPVSRPAPADAIDAGGGAPAPQPEARREARDDASGESGPPRWNPAEFERRTDPAERPDEDESEDVAVETDDDPFEPFEPLEDDEAIDDGSDGESGPPRLDSRPPAAGPHAHALAPAPQPQDIPGAGGDDGERLADPPREAPAPAASGADWQSWFKSLASEAESSAREAGETAEDEAAAVEEAILRNEAPGAQPEPVAASVHAPLPAAEGASGPAAPVIEPAGATSAFAAALRRAQGTQATSGTEAREQAVAAPARDAATAPIPVRPAGPRAGAASLESLPPRLRAKMIEAAEAPRETNPLPARFAIAAVLLLVVIGGAVIVQRVWFAGGGPPIEARPAVESENTTASEEDLPSEEARTPGTDRPSSAPPGSSAGSAAPALPRTASAAAEPAPPPARPSPPEAEAGSVPAPAPPSTAFMLSVGTYLNETRAQAEQTRLSANTTWQARVGTVQVDDVDMYRVTMGEFPTRLAAERAASDLIARGLVDEARIIPIRGR